MSLYRTALVVGRFQPFHYGHLHLLKTALKAADTLVIALGSSNIVDTKNPLSFATRQKMIQEVLAHEGMTERVRAIVASPDDPSDEVWLQKLLENVGVFDVTIGNNDWVNNVLRAAGYTALNLQDLERETYQATFIRQAFVDGGDWTSRVPPYLHTLVEPELAQRL